MSAKGLLRIAVVLLLLAMVHEGLFAQSRKRITLTSSPGISLGYSGSVGRFQAYSAGVGNLARPQQNAGGVLSTSIGRTGVAMTAPRGTRLQTLHPQSSLLLNSPNAANFDVRGAYGARNRNVALTGTRGVNTNVSARRQLQPRNTGLPALADTTPAPIVAGPNYANLNVGPGNLRSLTSKPGASLFAMRSGQSYIASLNQGKAGPLEAEQQEIRTLAPEAPGMYQDLMRKGEKAFKKGNFREAAVNFELAGELSLNSTESLLSLMHTHFATSTEVYGMTAYYLREVLKRFPELPLVRVHPKSFYGDSGNYVRDLIQLEKRARENEWDSNALFVLGYMKWRDDELEAARNALSQALGNCQSNELSEAIMTLWDGMVASGKVSGQLAPAEETTPKDVPTKDDSDRGKAGSIR